VRPFFSARRDQNGRCAERCADAAGCLERGIAASVGAGMYAMPRAGRNDEERRFGAGQLQAHALEEALGVIPDCKGA
jgi:hypothetical protein